MNSIINYVKKLTPFIKQSSVMDSIDNDRKLIITVLSPQLEKYAEYFKDEKNISPDIKIITSIVYKNISSKWLSNSPSVMLYKINETLNTIKTYSPDLEAIILRNIEESTATNGINVKKAYILQVVDYIHFVTTFSIILLQYMSILQSRHLGGDKEDGSELFPKKQIEEFNKLLPGYAKVLGFFSSTGAVLYKDFDNIPELRLGTNLDLEKLAVTQYVKNTKVIKSLPYIDGFVGNPIYLIRLAKADLNIAIYNERMDYAKSLELRLLDLKLKNNGENNPKLEKQINYYESKIARLKYENEKFVRGLE